MKVLLVLAGLVAVTLANYDSGEGYVNNDKRGQTVPLMGYDQNRDGLLDKADTNRDGKPDIGYPGYGFGHGFGVYNAHHLYDRQGKTVPVMGEDQNNDGVADYRDRNRDGKEDKHYYGYHGYPYGYAVPAY